MKGVVADAVPFHGWADLVNLDTGEFIPIEYKLHGRIGILWGDSTFIAVAISAKSVELLTREGTRRRIPIDLQSDNADGSANFRTL